MNMESPENPKEEDAAEKQQVFVVREDLAGFGLSPKNLVILLEKLNALHAEGKIQTVEQAREIAPTLDASILQKSAERQERQKPPRHTKKKGQKY